MKMMTAWKDSLSIFTPKKFKLFFLVTLNALKQAYQVFFKYWWWLILICIFLDAYNFLPLRTVRGYHDESVLYMSLVSMLYSLPLFLFFLSMRPSVDRKNLRYFSQYKLHSIYYFMSVLAIVFFSKLIFQSNSSMMKDGCIVVALPLLFILECFFLMFLLDGDGSYFSAVCSLYRAIKMILFNIPFAIIMVVFSDLMIFAHMILLILLYLFSGHMQAWIFWIVVIIAITILSCFLANFYTQKLYEQYRLYFKENN